LEALKNDKEELTHTINVNVYKSELKSEIDTSTSILYLEQGFGKDTLNINDFFSDEISSIPITASVVNERTGFQGTMTIYAIAAILLFFITFYTTKERVTPPVEQKTNLKNDVKDLLTNVPWLVLFAVGVVSLSYVSIRNGVIIYYFKYYVQDEFLVTSFFLSGTIVTIIAIAMTEWFSRKFGKKKVFIYSQIFSTLFMAMFFFLDRTDIVLMFVLQILFSFSAGPPAPIIFSMYTDCASYSEWKNGRRATGLVMSASTMAQKFGWTIGGALAGWLLAMYGFKANIIQSVETIYGIILMMSLIPAAGSLMAAGLMYFYKLDNKTMYEIEEELKERRLLTANE